MSSNDTARDIARPRFYMEAVQNKSKSEQEGRPIFDDREMVEVKIPGDKLSTYVGYVTDAERERWPEIYAAFKRGEERAASGTPLEHWASPNLTRSKVAELKASGILSVEELAGIPDNVLSKLGMGSRELRDQARAYLDSAKAGAGNAAMSAEITQLRQMVEALQRGSAPTSEPDEGDSGRPIDDLSNEEIKAYIKRETGEAPRGNPSRETLVARATEVASEIAARQAHESEAA